MNLLDETFPERPHSVEETAGSLKRELGDKAIRVAKVESDPALDKIADELLDALTERDRDLVELGSLVVIRLIEAKKLQAVYVAQHEKTLESLPQDVQDRIKACMDELKVKHEGETFADKVFVNPLEWSSSASGAQLSRATPAHQTKNLAQTLNLKKVGDTITLPSHGAHAQIVGTMFLGEEETAVR